MSYLTPGTYRHYKGGLYNVLGVAHYVTGDQVTPMVVYVGNSKLENSPPRVYVRDYDDFTAWISKETGKPTTPPRFDEDEQNSEPRFEHVPHLG